MIIETLIPASDFGYEPIVNFFLSRGVEHVTTVGYYMIAGAGWITVIVTVYLIVLGLGSDNKDEKEGHIGQAIGAALAGWGITYALCHAEISVFQTTGWIYLTAALLLGAGYRLRRRWLPFYYRFKAWLRRNKPVPVLPTPEKEIDANDHIETNNKPAPPVPVQKIITPPANPKHNSAMDKLNNMIGLDDVKTQVRKALAFAKSEQQRKRMGLPPVGMGLNMVFTGSPGTGKTTVARLIGEIYREAGLLRKGDLIEIGGRDLIAEYIGHTRIKVQTTIEKALDSVLFIDEAYALIPNDSARDFGPEALATLLPLIDEKRDRLVVIIAGYEKEMNHLLDFNPGMRSRFKTQIDFPDYMEAELMLIFEQHCREKRFVLTRAAKAKAKELFSDLYATRTKAFGNGRTVRNAFEQCYMNHALRLSEKKNPTIQDRQIFDVMDIPDFRDIKL